MDRGSFSVFSGIAYLYGNNHIQNSVTTLGWHVLGTQYLNRRLPESDIYIDRNTIAIK